MDAPIANEKSRKKMGAGAKAAIGTTAGMLALIVALNLLVAQRNSLPDITIPVTPAPNPNAYPFFVAAGKEIKNSKAIGFAISDSTRTKRAAPSRHADSAEDHVYTLAEKEALLRENRNALATLREGFKYSYGNPPVRSFTAIFPEFAKFRETARLLTLESQVEKGRGGWNGAAGSELDAVQMGVMIPRNGVLIADLVGIACEAIGRRPLWDDYKHLSAAQSLAALRRLEKIEAMRFPFADVIEEEKRAGQAGLLEWFHSPDRMTSDLANSDIEDAEKEPDWQKWERKIALKWVNKRLVFENYTRYMDQTIERNRKPYGLHLPLIPIPRDLFNQALDGVYDQAPLKQVTSETENHLLAVTLALHAYRESQGAYPASLAAIKANVPAALLFDPFAVKGDLRYRRDGAKYVLYSVGPDGRDDSGKPIYDKTKSDSNGGRARYFVQSDSVGDVVAGVNK